LLLVQFHCPQAAGTESKETRSAQSKSGAIFLPLRRITDSARIVPASLEQYSPTDHEFNFLKLGGILHPFLYNYPLF